nr:efflux RND transporter periplasmic adaptor subunit [Bradyrhizobium diazoefficiens]
MRWMNLDSAAAGLLVCFSVCGSTAASAQVLSLAGRDFDCLMEARVTVKLGAAVTGLVKKVLVDRGDIVKEGQAVAEMESDVQSAVVAVSRIRATNNFQMLGLTKRAEFLNRKVDRLLSLRKTEAVSQVAVDEAQTEAFIAEHGVKEAELSFKLAQSELERDEAALNLRTIKSPVDGVVTERLMYAGEYRHDANPLMTIAQIDRLNVEAFLPVSFYRQLTIGSVAEVRPEEPIGGVYKATVTVIDRVLDAASGTFRVRLTLPNADYELPAGTRCKLRFP